MEPNLRHPPKKMGKNDQRVGAQVDRPALQITVNKPFNYKDMISSHLS